MGIREIKCRWGFLAGWKLEDCAWLLYNDSSAEAGKNNGRGQGPQGYMFCSVCCEAGSLDASIKFKTFENFYVI